MGFSARSDASRPEQRGQGRADFVIQHRFPRQNIRRSLQRLPCRAGGDLCKALKLRMQFLARARDCAWLTQFGGYPFGNDETDQSFLKRFAAQDRIQRALFGKKGNPHRLADGKMNLVAFPPMSDIRQPGIEWPDPPASHHSAIELMHQQDMLREMQDAPVRRH